MHAWDRHTPIDETLRALDDLVRAGKVRYLGFSDTPAWKVAQAQVTAQLRNRSPLIALQIEYSLLERTVEGDLIPMAQELGLGVTPWSPLKGGLLSGKYTRVNAGKVSTKRDWAAAGLNETAYAIIDELLKIFIHSLMVLVIPACASKCPRLPLEACPWRSTSTAQPFPFFPACSAI
jgi:aryl-alcohol dehydrogenase-like predicted oxidoreductase